MFVLVYTNEVNKLKDLMLENTIYQNVWSNTVMSSSTENTFMIKQLIQIKNRYEEIIKLTTGTGQREDNNTGWLLDYEYIKNHYKLKAVDLSRQKELGADPKAIQQI